MKSSNYTARWNKQDTKQEDKVWKNRYMGKYKFVTAQHISESYKLVTVIAFRESQPRGLTGRIHSSLPFHIVWILYHGVYYLANSLNLVKKKKKRRKKKLFKDQYGLLPQGGTEDAKELWVDSKPNLL